MGRNFKKKKNNLVVLTSYTLLFSTLVFISVISVIYKNIYKVNAQIDIQTFTPTPIPPSQSEPTQNIPQAPVYQRPPQNPQPNTPQQFTSGAPTCVSNNALTNLRRIKVVVAGQGDNGDFYISNENGNLTAKDVRKEINKKLKDLQESGDLADIESEILSGLTEQRFIGPGNYTMSSSQEGGTCTVQIFRPSAATPTLFIYSPNTTVKPIISINYQEQNKDYFYYEYDSTNVSFNKPKEGWIVNKSDLKTFVKNLSNIFRLTPAESERLLFELNFSVADVKSDKLFIGLIQQKEVDVKLPLKIESLNNPKVLRYHFYISAANNEIVKSPKLNPIQRAESLILELGSWGEK